MSREPKTIERKTEKSINLRAVIDVYKKEFGDAWIGAFMATVQLRVE